MEMIQNTTRLVKVFLAWPTWVSTSPEPRNLSDCHLWWHFGYLKSKCENSCQQGKISIEILWFGYFAKGDASLLRRLALLPSLILRVDGRPLKKKSHRNFPRCWQYNPQLFRYCVCSTNNKSLRACHVLDSTIGPRTRLMRSEPHGAYTGREKLTHKADTYRHKVTAEPWWVLHPK